MSIALGIAFMPASLTTILPVSINWSVCGATLSYVLKVFFTTQHDSYNVYFDGTMEFSRGDHIPFAITAVTVVILCNILPLVIIVLYSLPRLHAILPVFPFMDNVLACYKDGTNGTRNHQYFGGVYYFTLLTLLLCYLWAEATIVFVLNAFICVVVGMLVAVVQPYKAKVYNTVDIILILGVGLSYAGIMCSLIAHVEAPYKHAAGIALVIAPTVIPCIYFVGYICFKICSKFWAQPYIIRRWKNCRFSAMMSDDTTIQPLLIY